MKYSLHIEQLELKLSGTGSAPSFRFPTPIARPLAPTVTARKRTTSTPLPLRDPNQAPKRARHDDHATSIAGAADIAKRAGGQKRKLLQAYANAGAAGLNDYEAAEQAGLLRKCFWKRCGELRAFGLIQEVKTAEGVTITRPGDSNVERIVCAITKLGIETLRTVEANA